MGEPMRVRAVQNGEWTEVRILMKHIMLSRLTWDKTGKLIRAHFIQTVRGTCNGKPVLHVNFGGSVARDPYFSFKFRGGKPGDKVAITWVDTENDSRTDEAIIT
jgi:sulfur-oxidizing protein SoxZ